MYYVRYYSVRDCIDSHGRINDSRASIKKKLTNHHTNLSLASFIKNRTS